MSPNRRALPLALAILASATALLSGQQKASKTTWTVPRTPWGHPDLQGSYTNKDEANTPLERPANLAGRDVKQFGDSELADLAKGRQAQAQAIAGGIGGAETGAGPTHWYDHLNAKGSRAWFIVDPADGLVPPMTPRARQREAVMAAINNARDGEGLADSWEDRSLYDRCITRGIPGSMMPVIYGNSYQILQSPDFVAIRYEMIHEARIIPLDGRSHVGSNIREYVGDARGRWDGTTLVVETTNFTNRTHFGYNFRYNSERMKLVERFTPTSPGKLTWEVTFDDPETYTRPWTFAMQLARDDGQSVFEYACHEGNKGLEHILSAARAEERAAAK
jgi:hypothetical protein